MEQPLELLDPCQEPGWDALVKSHPDGCFFHCSAWASVLKEAYGHRPVYFTRRSGGELKSLVPAMEINSFLTGKRGVSLPFTDYCPVLGSEGLTSGDVLQEAVSYGREHGWKSFEARGGAEAGRETSAETSFYVHEIDLRGGESAVFQRCKSGVRTAIRKAGQGKLKIEFTDSLESMRTFYSLHCRTRGKHGLPPQPFSFFERIWENVISQKLGFIAIVAEQQRPIAAAVFFHFGKAAIYKYGASDDRFQHLRPNNLLFAEVIKKYCGEGIERLHLGRTSLDNEGLRRFKLGWGAVEQGIAYWKYDLRLERLSAPRDGASGWYNTIFSLMPSTVSRMCGELLYRHVS